MPRPARPFPERTVGVDPRGERIGKNEALFRAVNEQVTSLGPSPRDDQAIGILCECADANCLKQIRITLTEYESVRQNSARFAVVQGHEMPEFERIIESTDRYHVIEKHAGTPQKVARDTDPRT